MTFIRRTTFCIWLCATFLLTVPPECRAQGANWPFAGGNRNNDRNAATENKIGPGNASRLTTKWTFTTGGDVSATPAVFGTVLYVPDWGGNLYKLHADTGAIMWSRRIADYTGIAAAVSRTTPAVSENKVVVGTQAGGHILAINANSGELIWKVRADTNEFAIITQSPVVFDGVVYVGVSSSEEGAQANIPGYIPSFRGSVLALDLNTGAILWRTHMVPIGYTGGAVWGSTPVVDPQRGSVYVATGNNYTIPAAAQSCVDLVRGRIFDTPAERAAAEEACLAPDDYIDAVVALDIKTGAVKWANRVQGADTWTVACIRAAPANPCPDPLSPDYDFGSGPNLFATRRNGRRVELLGAGQKSGVYWAFNPDNGEVVWATPVGPGGTLGGIEWGSATDGQRIYVAIANNSHQQYRLGGPTGPLHNAGSWAALDAATGAILWQIPVLGQDPRNPQFGAMGLGAVSVANGVMYAGSMSGHLAVIDAATGRILQSFLTAGSVICGPSIVGGTVYWGSGYGRVGGVSNTAGPQLFAFTIKD